MILFSSWPSREYPASVTQSALCDRGRTEKSIPDLDTRCVWFHGSSLTTTAPTPSTFISLSVDENEKFLVLHSSQLNRAIAATQTTSKSYWCCSSRWICRCECQSPQFDGVSNGRASIQLHASIWALDETRELCCIRLHWVAT